MRKQYLYIKYETQKINATEEGDNAGREGGDRTIKMIKHGTSQIYIS